jgi:hypothetical protein
MSPPFPLTYSWRALNPRSGGWEEGWPIGTIIGYLILKGRTGRKKEKEMDALRWETKWFHP